MLYIHTSRIKIEKVLDIKGLSAAIDFQCGFWVKSNFPDEIYYITESLKRQALSRFLFLMYV